MGVTPEEAQEFAARFDAKTFEVSAKTGQGVAEMFEAAARHLVDAHI